MEQSHPKGVNCNFQGFAQISYDEETSFMWVQK